MKIKKIKVPLWAWVVIQALCGCYILWYLLNKVLKNGISINIGG